MPKSNFEQYQEFQDYTNYIEYNPSNIARLTSCLASIKTSREAVWRSTTS
jgi:hypothetical protein